METRTFEGQELIPGVSATLEKVLLLQELTATRIAASPQVGLVEVLLPLVHRRLLVSPYTAVEIRAHRVAGNDGTPGERRGFVDYPLVGAHLVVVNQLAVQWLAVVYVEFLWRHDGVALFADKIKRSMLLMADHHHFRRVSLPFQVNNRIDTCTSEYYMLRVVR